MNTHTHNRRVSFWLPMPLFYGSYCLKDICKCRLRYKENTHWLICYLDRSNTVINCKNAEYVFISKEYMDDLPESEKIRLGIPSVLKNTKMT